jgi:hypothetical protein
MPKKASSKRAIIKQRNKQTLASVKKEMKLPRKAHSVLEEEITHHHTQLQRRRAS